MAAESNSGFRQSIGAQRYQIDRSQNNEDAQPERMTGGGVCPHEKRKEFMRKIAVLFISAVTALTSFAPAQAFPVAAVKAQTAQSDIVQVGDHRGRKIIRRNHQGNNWDRNRHSRWDRNRRDDRRGYYRDDYRRHRNNNAGAIIGGLAAGAIIGGAIASQPRYSNGNSHTQSCYARYRSYRAYDNTYQPNYGPRRQCN
jgi:hypothetical protein